ncbi:hypothetical protein ACLB2K_032052 [Fragaria x ananassa]
MAKAGMNYITEHPFLLNRHVGREEFRCDEKMLIIALLMTAAMVGTTTGLAEGDRWQPKSFGWTTSNWAHNLTLRPKPIGWKELLGVGLKCGPEPWKCNDFVFRHKLFSAHSVVACAASYFQPNSCAISNTILSPRCDSIKWTPPSGIVKINFDVSVVQPSSNAVMGFLLGDDASCPIVAAAHSIGKTIVSVAQAIALRDSLLKAKEKEFKKVIVEGDSSLIINCVNSKFKCL